MLAINCFDEHGLSTPIHTTEPMHTNDKETIGKITYIYYIPLVKKQL